MLLVNDKYNMASRGRKIFIFHLIYRIIKKKM